MPPPLRQRRAAAAVESEARFSIPLYIDARWLFFHANGSFFNAYILAGWLALLSARRNFKLQFSIIFSMQAAVVNGILRLAVMMPAAAARQYVVVTSLVILRTTKTAPIVELQAQN